MCQPTWHARLLGVCVKMFVVKIRTQPNVHLETDNNKCGWIAPGRTAENIKSYGVLSVSSLARRSFQTKNPRNRSTPGGGRVRADGPDNTSEWSQTWQTHSHAATTRRPEEQIFKYKIHIKIIEISFVIRTLSIPTVLQILVYKKWSSPYNDSVILSIVGILYIHTPERDRS